MGPSPVAPSCDRRGSAGPRGSFRVVLLPSKRRTARASRWQADHEAADLDSRGQFVEMRLGVNEAGQRRGEVEASEVEHLIRELVSRERKLAVCEQEPAGDSRERGPRLLLGGVEIACRGDSFRELQERVSAIVLALGIGPETRLDDLGQRRAQHAVVDEYAAEAQRPLDEVITVAQPFPEHVRRGRVEVNALAQILEPRARTDDVQIEITNCGSPRTRS